jgi:hypothetical protein
MDCGAPRRMAVFSENSQSLPFSWTVVRHRRMAVFLDFIKLAQDIQAKDRYNPHTTAMREYAYIALGQS